MRLNMPTDMTDIPEPHPPIIPPSQNPPVYGPVDQPPTFPQQPATPPPPVAHKKPIIPLWAFVAGAIFIVLLVAMVAFNGTSGGATQITPSPTPTATASAVSNRVLTSIASESAFTKFEADLDALGKGIQNAQVQNQQLLPPRLELPLGF
jgi:hypothetical protein